MLVVSMADICHY